MTTPKLVKANPTLSTNGVPQDHAGHGAAHVLNTGDSSLHRGAVLPRSRGRDLHE